MTGRRLSLDWLEPRWLLSGDSGAAPSATYPANADPLAQSPSSLAIDFNKNQASGTWVPGDVQLTQSPSSLTINFDRMLVIVVTGWMASSSSNRSARMAQARCP